MVTKQKKAANEKAPKLALAIQGSFGHIFYAAGVLDAFRAHNHDVQKHGAASKQKAINIATASSCVEMLTPLWIYLADQQTQDSMRDILLNADSNLPPWIQNRIAPPSVRPDAWNNYLTGLIEAQSRCVHTGIKLFTHAFNQNGFTSLLHESVGQALGDIDVATSSTAATAAFYAAIDNMLMYGSGLPGQIAFSPLFTEAKKAELDALFTKDKGPTVFTNATRATDFEEIYQYTGTTPNSEQLAAMVGSKQKRKAMRMTPESFFASGARPPYIAPMPVTVDGQTEYWMEGAMRCNPPLTPLIDMDATHILVLRFFSKDAHRQPNNSAELNERFLDAIFNIPLQKEIESIEFNNDVARCLEHLPDDASVAKNLRRRREITVIDPADGNNDAASPRFIEFLSEELNALSHYDANFPARRAQMFDRGVQIGKQLIADLQKHLPSTVVADTVPTQKKTALRLMQTQP
jgi:predicted patatin/cPLA2 family phospholipase